MRRYWNANKRASFGSQLACISPAIIMPPTCFYSSPLHACLTVWPCCSDIKVLAFPCLSAPSRAAVAFLRHVAWLAAASSAQDACRCHAWKPMGHYINTMCLIHTCAGDLLQDYLMSSSDRYGAIWASRCWLACCQGAFSSRKQPCEKGSSHLRDCTRLEVSVLYTLVCR